MVKPSGCRSAESTLVGFAVRRSELVGLAPSTLTRRLSAIAVAHRLAGINWTPSTRPLPMCSPVSAALCVYTQTCWYKGRKAAMNKKRVV
jgi:hypothetical protein